MTALSIALCGVAALLGLLIVAAVAHVVRWLS